MFEKLGLDWKHVVGAVLGGVLALGLKLAAEKGIDIKCPANPSAVIEAGK